MNILEEYMSKKIEAIKKIKSFSVSPTNYFGDGYNTSDMFIQILNNEDLWKISTQKYFVD